MTAGALAFLATWLWWSPGRSVRPSVTTKVVGVWTLLLGSLGAAGLVVGAPGPTVLAVVVGTAAWAGHRRWRARLRSVAVAAVSERVLECCDLLAAELAAGQPPDAALARAAETWPAMASAAQTHAYGGDVPSALRRLALEPGAEGLTLVAAAWHVTHRTGHGLADAIARVAESLREARATQRVVRGELASARATARLVAALPLVALAIGAGSGGNPFGFLLATPLGLACLASGLALGISGLAWIDRIADDAAR